MDKKFICKSICNLSMQKGLLKQQISQIVFGHPELSETELKEINKHKNTIKEIDAKIEQLKQDYKKLDENSNFECSYSVTSVNGQKKEVFKVNGKEVLKPEYIKALKENATHKMHMLDKFTKGFNFFESFGLDKLGFDKFGFDKPASKPNFFNFFKNEFDFLEDKDHHHKDEQKHHHEHHKVEKEDESCECTHEDHCGCLDGKECKC